MANCFVFLFLLETMVYGFSHPTITDRQSKRSDILVHDVIQQMVAEQIERMKILKEFKVLKNEIGDVKRELKERNTLMKDTKILERKLLRKINNVKEELKKASMAEVKKVVNDVIQRISLVQNEVTVIQNKTSSFWQVAFTAKLKDDPTTSSAIIFKSVITNISDGYNNRDKIFYCPKPGLYMFSASLMAYGVNWVDGYIIKNNVKTAKLHENIGPSNNYYPAATTTVMLRLVIGDKVWVKGSGIRYYGAGTCTFSGILIRN